jgi:hypothetical protein
VASFTHAREQLLTDGYCIVDGELPDGTIEALRSWSNDWLTRTKHSPKWRYQGSDIHISGVRHTSKRNPDLPQDATVDFLIEHPRNALEGLGLGDFRSGGTFQIISKPAKAPPLYWHQDWARWDDPISLSPWPQQVFVNWYLTDTTARNGCLRVIPGSHRRRIDLHGQLIAPHEGGGYDVEETNEWMFYDHPDAIDVEVNVGELVIADARLLHATHPNASDERRTVLLGWFFRTANTVPDGWAGEVPEEILERNRDLPFVFNRNPGEYLQ